MTDDHANFTAACGVPVRVVGSPWTTYRTHGKEHISPCHFWRPEDAGRPDLWRAPAARIAGGWWRRLRAKAGLRRVVARPLAPHRPAARRHTTRRRPPPGHTHPSPRRARFGERLCREEPRAARGRPRPLRDAADLACTAAAACLWARTRDSVAGGTTGGAKALCLQAGAAVLLCKRGGGALPASHHRPSPAAQRHSRRRRSGGCCCSCSCCGRSAASRVRPSAERRARDADTDLGRVEARAQCAAHAPTHRRGAARGWMGCGGR